MLTGDELRSAREAAHMTQQGVADRVGKSMRSVGNWERSDVVPRPAEGRIRAAFPEWFGQPAAPLSSVSDAQLLAEIARRFERGGKEGGSGGDTAAKTPAGDARDEEAQTGDTVEREQSEATASHDPVTYLPRQ